GVSGVQSDAIPSSPHEFMRRENRRGEIGRGPKWTEAVPLGMLKGVTADTVSFLLAARPLRTVPALADERTLTFRVWADDDAVTGMPPVNILGPSFLKILVPPQCRAIGLVDESGSGPIVVTPPFRYTTEVTFLADAVATGGGPRYLNPSAARETVAVVNPTEDANADLLAP